MTPLELKNSILQLAIQGKLVEQRPEEGTAEELYKQIQDKKQALIKAGKIKKGKPLPEIIDDEIPFEIPENWKWVRLGDCTSYAHTKEKVLSTEIDPESWSLDLEDIEKESGILDRRREDPIRSFQAEKPNSVKLFFITSLNESLTFMRTAYRLHIITVHVVSVIFLRLRQNKRAFFDNISKN